MSDDLTEFPLPFDATDDERAAARTEIGKHSDIRGEEPRLIRFVGRALGQTGPIWHFQYLRMYQVPTGYLVAGHDLRDGIKVAFSETADGLARAFDNEAVNEFIADELRFRGVLGSEHARA